VIEQVAGIGGYPVHTVCKTLSVSRAGYYAWLEEVESDRARRDRELTPWVRAIFWRHKRRYGARRIAQELKFRGRPCGVARVANLLKNQGLQAIQPRSFRPRTTESRHALGYSPNLLRDRDEPRRIDEVCSAICRCSWICFLDGSWAGNSWRR
jgi:hypothetical protein